MVPQKHQIVPITILIVDEDGPTLDLYANALKQYYHVVACSTWHDAMAALSAQKIKLIVLEPSVIGYWNWALLEDLTRVYGVSVIICSALEDRRNGLEAGALAYLVKPVLPSTLLETIKSILN